MTSRFICGHADTDECLLSFFLYTFICCYLQFARAWLLDAVVYLSIHGIYKFWFNG
jgi:hypothetical protein